MWFCWKTAEHPFKADVVKRLQQFPAEQETVAINDGLRKTWCGDGIPEFLLDISMLYIYDQ